MEIPRKQRFAGRQSLEVLFSDTTDFKKEFRNQKIARAHLEYGYTLKEIADSIVVHYTTVSKIVRKKNKWYFKTWPQFTPIYFLAAG